MDLLKTTALLFGDCQQLDDGTIQLVTNGIPRDLTSTELSKINTKDSELQAEYDSKQYARDRAAAYPSLTDQADMAYWDRKNGTTTLDDAIAAVKDTFPKG